MEAQDGAELCFPQLLNTSCRKPARLWSQVVFLSFLLSTISVLTVTLNLLIIISISHFRQLHKPTNLLILSLSVSDFLVGLVLLPEEILRRTACWFLGDVMCTLLKCVATISVSASVGNMVFISLDRYVAICYPLHYPTRVTVRKVKLGIFLSSLLSAVYRIFFVKTDLLQKHHNSCNGECLFDTDYIVGMVDLLVTFSVPVAVIIFLYMRVFVVAVSQARAMRSHITAVTLQHSVTVTTKKSELKAARTLGVLVIVFLMCFIPFYCVALAGENFNNTPSGDFVTCIFFFNSCLNPLMYALFYPWFRKAVKLIVTLQMLQPDSREANVQ